MSNIQIETFEGKSFKQITKNKDIPKEDAELSVCLAWWWRGDDLGSCIHCSAINANQTVQWPKTKQ